MPAQPELARTRHLGKSKATSHFHEVPCNNTFCLSSEIFSLRLAALCLTGHLRSATVDPRGLFVEPLQRAVIRPPENYLKKFWVGAILLDLKNQCVLILFLFVQTLRLSKMFPFCKICCDSSRPLDRFWIQRGCFRCHRCW